MGSSTGAYYSTYERLAPERPKERSLTASVVVGNKDAREHSGGANGLREEAPVQRGDAPGLTCLPHHLRLLNGCLGNGTAEGAR